MKNILSVEKIEKYYGSKNNVTKALDNISFNVYEGEFLGIMGPSGSGKTTLLNFDVDHCRLIKLLLKSIKKYNLN